jgi:hypothetical protein
MVADNHRLLHSFFIINAGDAYMSKEKIVYTLNSKLLLYLYFFCKEQQNSMPVMVLNTLYPRKNNFEVNLYEKS